MVQTAGRDNVIKKNGVTIGGGRTLGFKVAGSPVDITDQNDQGYQTLLSGVTTGISMELNIDGYEEDGVLFGISMGDPALWHMTDITFESPRGVISGDFFMSGYEETGEYEEGTTFTATFTSSCSWGFAAA